MDNTTTTITLNPNTPMKEIPMNELKNNTESINDSFKQLLARGDAIIRNCRALMDENVRLRKEVENWKEFNDALARYGISVSGLDAASALDGKLTLLDTIENLMDEHQIENADDLAFVLKNYDKFKGIASDLGCIQNCDPDELRGKVEDLKKNTEPADYQVLKDFKGEMDAIHEEYNIPKDVRELRSVLDDWKEMKEACDSYRCDPDELDEKLGELEAIKSEMEDHNIDDARDLGDCLEEWEDANAYEKGFNELAEFVEKIKEVIGHQGDDIPATDMEDYK